MITLLRKTRANLLSFFIPTGFRKTMNPSEALLIISPKRNSVTEIELRYKDLVKRNHPDREGSPYIMGKINEARKMLLRLYKK